MAQVYLLAAGRGRRAGGPKAWLPAHGKPLLERHLSFLCKRFPGDAVAVSIQEAWEGRCRLLAPEVRWTCVDPDLPALASLQALVRRSAPPQGRWAFVYHVDMPVWEPALFDALLARTPVSKADAVVPCFAGRGGHPLLVRAGGLEAIGKLDAATDRLDAWLRGRRVERLDVPWPCVVENWNGGPAA